MATPQATSHAEFDELIEPHRRELLAYCYRMLGSLHDAEDALQDALLRAWRGIESFDWRSSLRTWLYRIATNTSLDVIARRKKAPVLPEDHGPPAAQPARGADPARGTGLLGPGGGRLDGQPARPRSSALQRARATMDERVPDRSEQEAAGPGNGGWVGDRSGPRGLLVSCRASRRFLRVA